MRELNTTTLQALWEPHHELNRAPWKSWVDAAEREAEVPCHGPECQVEEMEGLCFSGKGQSQMFQREGWIRVGAFGQVSSSSSGLDAQVKSAWVGTISNRDGRPSLIETGAMLWWPEHPRWFCPDLFLGNQVPGGAPE